MEWTFDDIPFIWLKNSNRTLPTWKRTEEKEITQIIGTDDSEMNLFGASPYQISGEILIESQSDYVLLEVLNNREGTISDGTSSWTAVMELAVDGRAPSPVHGYTGPATFIRLQANEDE